jgi:CDP-2,3-bis-(O-geranylgeranyl)-sn-glycerol synthase
MSPGELIEFLLESIWFLLPSYVATIIPVFARKINFLDISINDKIFGKNKTYRGFLFGILFSIVTVYLQVFLYKKYLLITAISIVNYDKIDYLLFGFLMGFGALFGDLVKSFFKRQLKIKEGASWFPFDQFDFVIGSLIFVSVVFIPSLVHVICMITISIILHYIVVRISYSVGLR